jgi:predicted membrane-bound spermidine synthase
MKIKFTNIKIQTALGLSAASALLYEVVATHLLFFYFIESSYSIATVLSVFLLGLALGSLTIYYFSNKIKNKHLLFAVLQIAIALYAFTILSNLRDIIPKISTLGTFVTSFLILLVPTIFLGAIFPLASLIFKRDKKEITGLVYSSDLFGAILGTLFTGFILIPEFGVKITIIIGAILNITSALIMFPKKQKIISLLLLFIFIGSTFNIPSVTHETPVLTYEKEEYNKDGYQYYANSPYGLVTVKNDALFIEGRIQCCLCYHNDTSERLMVVYALEPLQDYSGISVLNIGLGCGLTLEKCLQYNTVVDVVEINEKVVEANKIMTDVLLDKRVNLIIDDGLNYLRNNNKYYDSILIDIENPRIAHASNLYTADAFKIIFNSLTDTGTFALWSYGGNSHYYDILYYSLKETFPYVYQYSGVFLATKNPLIDNTEYTTIDEYEINTIDKNTLTNAFLGE